MCEIIETSKRLTTFVLVASCISPMPGSVGRGEPVRGGPLTLCQQHRMLPTVRWKEGWLMPYGNPVPDPICGRCKKRLEMAVRPEAVYQDGIWFHTACHREGADQLFRATRLAAVLTAGKRGVESITSPLFQGAAPPGWHADEGKRCPRT